MRSHFNLDVLTVFPQDVLSAANGEGRKLGRTTELKLKYDHRDGGVSDKLCIVSFFILIWLCNFLYKFGVCTIWQFVLPLTSVKITQMTVQLCDGILWLYSYVAQGIFLDTRGRHFWMMTALLCLLLGLPCTWNGSVPAAHSQAPTFFIHQFFEKVEYAEFSCGSKWNQNCAHQVNCAQAEDPGVYLGKNI